ncbi:MAG TPA: DUF3168 domain-containing protein [Ktedonobacteraceae bacterium]|nr:DUF3168 domain-containing protein [Ktedonobacteraceae bacterium]
MALPNGAIMNALITRYRADTALATLLGNPTNPPGAIFDGGGGVPTNQPFPYIAVYIPTSQSGTTLAMDQDAVDSYVQVSVFTQPGAGGGMKQARDIIERVYALTQPPAPPLDLSASGFAQFFLLFENEQEVPPNQDGLTPMIAHRYHLMTQTL